MLAPAIWASLMIAFAISIDDFVISAFLMGDQSSATIPVKLYSAARLAPSPGDKRSAFSCSPPCLLSPSPWSSYAVRTRRKEREALVEDFARLDL